MGIKAGSAAIGVGAVLGTILVERGIKKLLPNLFGAEIPTMDTPLERFEGSHAYAKRLGEAKDVVNWAQLYEELCVLNPVGNQNDPRIPAVLEHYKALLSGTEADPEGRHVPSEVLNGRMNPDYTQYLKAQARIARTAGRKATVLRREAKVSGYRKSLQEVQDEMIAHLITELECPMCVAGVVVTEERLEKETPETWRQIARFAAEYVKMYEEGAVEVFANLATTEEFLDSTMMELFSMYFIQGVPDNITLMILRGEISGEQAEKSAELVDTYRKGGMTWEVALRRVLAESGEKAQGEDLRDKYHSAIRG